MQAVSGIDGVARLVPQDSHAPFLGSTLHIEHLPAFQPCQTRVGQVKRHRHARHSVGREPLVGNPEMRPEGDPPGSQLLVKPLNPTFEGRPLDRKLQIAHPHLEKLGV